MCSNTLADLVIFSHFCFIQTDWLQRHRCCVIHIYQITGGRPCFTRCLMPLSGLVTVLLPLPTNWGERYCWERTSVVAHLPPFPLSPKAEERGDFLGRKANVEWLYREWDLGGTIPQSGFCGEKGRCPWKWLSGWGLTQRVRLPSHLTLPDPMSLTLILILLRPADCWMGMLPDVFSLTPLETQYKLGGRWEVLSSCLGSNWDNPPPPPCHLTGVRK